MEEEELVLARESSSDIPSLEEHTWAQIGALGEDNAQGLWFKVWGSVRSSCLEVPSLTPLTQKTFQF